MYVQIIFTDENEETFRWYQVPTDNPQTAAMFALCYCKGYSDCSIYIGKDFHILKAVATKVQREEPDAGNIEMLPS